MKGINSSIKINERRGVYFNTDKAKLLGINLQPITNELQKIEDRNEKKLAPTDSTTFFVHYKTGGIGLNLHHFIAQWHSLHFSTWNRWVPFYFHKEIMDIEQ